MESQIFTKKNIPAHLFLNNTVYHPMATPDHVELNLRVVVAERH